MAKQEINIGAAANDGTGDQLRTAFDKTNDNFVEVYGGTASIARTTVPGTLVGAAGDIAGMIAIDATNIYVCHTDYDGSATIWSTLTFAEANDLSAAVNWIDVPDANITETAVVQHRAAVLTKEIVAEGSAAYALTLSDAGKIIRMSNGGGNIVTIPANASVAFPIGTEITVIQEGAGTTTIAITTDTANAKNSLAISLQYGVATLTKVDTTTWIVSGDLT